MSKLVLVLDSEFSKYPLILINLKIVLNNGSFKRVDEIFGTSFVAMHTCLRFLKNHRAHVC
jgi:hypothetical protein